MRILLSRRLFPEVISPRQHGRTGIPRYEVEDLVTQPEGEAVLRGEGRKPSVSSFTSLHGSETVPKTGVARALPREHGGIRLVLPHCVRKRTAAARWIWRVEGHSAGGTKNRVKPFFRKAVFRPCVPTV